MKTKILFILTTLVLLLFTGCDAILNAAYPEYDLSQEYDMEYNKITTDVLVDSNLGLDLWDIVVMVVPVNEFDLETLYTYDAQTTSYYKYTQIYNTFTNLENTTYMAFAFQDRDWDLAPDWDEPGIVLKTSDLNEIIDLEFKDSIQTVYGDLNSVLSRIPTIYTNQF